MLEHSRAQFLQDRCHFGGAWSIVQQVGAMLASGAFLLLTCWVMAIARGPAAYSQFLSLVTHPLVRVPLALGLSGLVFHSCKGILQRPWDDGFRFEHRGRTFWRHGAGPGWVRRSTALGVLVLGAWFLVSVVSIATLSYARVSAWMARPGNAALLLALILVGVEYSNRGVSAIVESGVEDPGMRLTILLLIRGVHLLAAASAVVAVCAVALGNFR